MTRILDSSGRPMQPASPRAPAPGRRASAGLPPLNNNSSVFPYQASQWQTEEMGNWLPWIRSPDAEINLFRDRMVARSRDLVRNDGWASGGIETVLDNTIGADLRLIAKPDWRFLAATLGLNVDAVWADKFRRVAEAIWRGYSEDPLHYNDRARQITGSQQMRLMLRHQLIDGENLVVKHWRPDRIGKGAARYATCFEVVDPDRLSNPNQMVDTKHMRNGVEIDDDGVVVAYHIRSAHQNDWYNAVESMEWVRVPREDADGWQRVYHGYDRDRAGQSRGIGVMTPILQHAKMLAKYYGVELQAATLATIFGTYVKSPYDPAQIEEAMAGPDEGELSMYQSLRSEFAHERGPLLNGVRIPTLFPGEEIAQVNAAHPHTGFNDFAREMQRLMASAFGISGEQLSKDYSQTNYSSYRGAMVDVWKVMVRRLKNFTRDSATPMYAAILEEAFDRGDLDEVLPANCPDFIEVRGALTRCDWIGAPRGWIDPVKEIQGSTMAIDSGLSTLQQECADQGNDWEEVLEQRAIEQAKALELGVELQSWPGVTEPEKPSDESTPAGKPTR